MKTTANLYNGIKIEDSRFGPASPEDYPEHGYLSRVAGGNAEGQITVQWYDSEEAALSAPIPGHCVRTVTPSAEAKAIRFA